MLDEGDCGAIGGMKIGSNRGITPEFAWTDDDHEKPQLR
jgi:hypothetical protein